MVLKLQIKRHSRSVNPSLLLQTSFAKNLAHLSFFRFALLPSICWWLLLCLGQLFVKPSLYPDPAPGLLAALQYIHGISPSLREVFVADLAHGGQLRSTQITWWPPGYQFLPWLMMKYFSLNIGEAVGLTIRLCLLAGMCGWYLYYAKILGPIPALLTCTLVSTWRFFHHNLFFYDGGELLLFAASPWVLLLLVSAIQGGSIPRLAFAGIFTAVLFVLKYSAAVFSLTFSISASLCILQKKNHRRWLKALIPVICCGLTLLVFLRTLCAGGATPATPGQREGWNAIEVLWHWLSWPLNFGDLDAFCRRILLNDASTEADLLRLAFPAGVVLAAVLLLVPSLLQKTHWANFTQRFYLLAAVFSLVATLLLVSTVGVLGGALSWESRYYRIPVLMLLPFFLNAIATCLASRSTKKICAALPALCLFTLGSLYGIAAFTTKAASQLLEKNFQNTLWRDLSLPVVDRSTPVAEIINKVHQHLQNHPSHVLVVGDVRMALPFADKPMTIWHPTLLLDTLPTDAMLSVTPVVLVNTKAQRAQPTLETLQTHPYWQPASIIHLTDNWRLIPMCPRPPPQPKL